MKHKMLGEYSYSSYMTFIVSCNSLFLALSYRSCPTRVKLIWKFWSALLKYLTPELCGCTFEVIKEVCKKYMLKLLTKVFYDMSIFCFGTKVVATCYFIRKYQCLNFESMPFNYEHELIFLLCLYRVFHKYCKK